jgi:hypothetical protein
MFDTSFVSLKTRYSCDKPTQDATGRLTYSGLVTTKDGRDVARSLLNSVINQQLSHQVGVSDTDIRSNQQ